MHTMQIFNPLSKQKSLRCKGLHESEACGYGCFITYPREVRLSSRDVFQQVSSGIADFGFLADEIDTGKLEHSVLFSENAVIVMPQNHPLTKKSVITLKDLSETDFIALNPEDRIQKTLTQAMRSQGLSLKTRIETPYSLTVCELARCGVGVGAANPIVAVDFLGKGLQIRHIDIPLHFTSLLIFRPGKKLSEPARSFISFVRLEQDRNMKKLRQANF